MGMPRQWLGRVTGPVAAPLLAWGPKQAPARAQGGDLAVLAAANRNCAPDQAPAEWQMRRWVTGSMPAGKHARAAFVQPSLWTGADKRIALRESLHTLLDAHEPAGNAHPGDAAADPSLKAIGTLLKSRHAPSTHPLAGSASASDRAAAEALAYVRLDEAKPPFKAQVFTLAGQRRC